MVGGSENEDRDLERMKKRDMRGITTDFAIFGV